MMMVVGCINTVRDNIHPLKLSGFETGVGSIDRSKTTARVQGKPESCRVNRLKIMRNENAQHNHNQYDHGI